MKIQFLPKELRLELLGCRLYFFCCLFLLVIIATGITRWVIYTGFLFFLMEATFLGYDNEVSNSKLVKLIVTVFVLMTGVPMMLALWLTETSFWYGVGIGLSGLFVGYVLRRNKSSIFAFEET